jgi:hypothetical protein
MTKSTSFRVSNDASQSERRAVAANDRRVRTGTTYSEIAASEVGTIGGRFSSEARQRVIGSGPVSYPVLPQGAFPNQAAGVPSEPSLGVAIDQMEPCGTYAEIKKSIEKSLAESKGSEGIKNPSLPPNGPPNGGSRATPGGLLAAASRRSRRLSKHKG